MSQVLSGLHFCFMYLDDILVYSASWEEHLQHLKVVFQHLKEADLKIKLSKWQFFKAHSLFRSPYLQTGYTATTGKVAAIKVTGTQKCGQVLSFLKVNRLL